MNIDNVLTFKFDYRSIHSYIKADHAKSFLLNGSLLCYTLVRLYKTETQHACIASS